MTCKYPKCVGGENGTICTAHCNPMSLREAARAALMALRNSLDLVKADYYGDWRLQLPEPLRGDIPARKRQAITDHDLAITNLRIALEEAEQEDQMLALVRPNP